MLNTINPRYKRFMDNYSLTGNILKSATQAGFSEKYARHQGKKILNTALRLQTQQLMKKSTNHEITAKEAKETMLDILGKSSIVLKERLNKIAFEQDKDYSSAIKILTPLAKELGIDITQQETTSVTVPILNLTFKGNTDTPQIEGDVKDTPPHTPV